MKKGFSLLEMLLVLLIVSVIAAASAPMLNKKLINEVSDSECLWTRVSTTNNIAYNLNSNDNSSVLIGASTIPNNEKTSLYVTSKSEIPQLTLGIDKNIKAKLSAFGDNIWLSTKVPSEVKSSVALGGASEASSNSIAIGYKSNATNPKTIAIGDNSTATDKGAIALGKDAKSGISDAIAIGSGAGVDGTSGIAIGVGANVAHEAQGGIAIGNSANALNNQYAIALGTSANALNKSAIAIGYNSNSSGTNSLALGENAQAENDHCIAIGSGVVSKNSAITIGKGASADESGIVFGRGVSANGTGIVIGNTGFANNTGVALGTIVNASNAAAIAIGDNVNVTQVGSIAIGRNINMTNSQSVAIGSGASVTGHYGIAMGINSIASTKSVAIGAVESGTKTNAQENSVAIGCSATTSGASAVVIGKSSSAGKKSVAIGSESTATGENTIVIGSGINSAHSNSISIGAAANQTNQVVLGNADTTVYIPGKLVVDKTAVLGASGAYRTYLRVRKGLTSSYALMSLRIDDSSQPTFLTSNDETLSLAGYTTSATSTPSREYNGTGTPNRTSDRRLKNIGEHFTAGLEQIKMLEVFNFTFKKDPLKTPRVGVIAQDLQKVFPNAVTKGDDGFFRIRWDEMFFAVINAVKELDLKISELRNKEVLNLQSRIADLEKQNKALVKKNEEFEKRLAKLEKAK